MSNAWLTPTFMTALIALISGVIGLVRIMAANLRIDQTNATATTAASHAETAKQQAVAAAAVSNGTAKAIQRRLDEIEGAVAEFRALGLTPKTVLVALESTPNSTAPPNSVSAP